MTGRGAFWLLFAVTLAVYLALVAWSLPIIARAAGGLVPFDLRPRGYSFDEARAFLAALTDAGLRQYAGPQRWLDAAYPALMFLVLFFALRWTFRDGPAWIRAGLIAAAALGALFDYAENLAVAGMLADGADGITKAQVARASLFSQAKAALTTVAGVGLLAGLAPRAWRGLKGR